LDCLLPATGIEQVSESERWQSRVCLAIVVFGLLEAAALGCLVTGTLEAPYVSTMALVLPNLRLCLVSKRAAVAMVKGAGHVVDIEQADSRSVTGGRPETPDLTITTLGHDLLIRCTFFYMPN
jgi:hypothetical protein